MLQFFQHPNHDEGECEGGPYILIFFRKVLDCSHECISACGGGGGGGGKNLFINSFHTSSQVKIVLGARE